MKPLKAWARSPVAALLLMVAISTGAARADNSASTESYTPEVETQCRDDYFRFCSPYALGSLELRQCMEAKGQSLSPHCQRALVDAGLVRPRQSRKGS